MEKAGEGEDFEIFVKPPNISMLIGLASYEVAYNVASQPNAV